MPRVKDLTGGKFGRLTVISQKGINKLNRALWLCKCECGNEKILVGHDIENSRVKSCGCLGVEVRKENMKKGWKPKKEKAKPKTSRKVRCRESSRIANIYNHMRNRCYNENDDRFKDYGERGIRICEEWLNDFLAFKKWALENGYSDILSIDRIDVNGNYEPSNCRWATNKEQAHNRRSNRIVTLNGVSKNVTQWSEIVGIKSCVISTRLNRGWTVQEALNPKGRGKNV